MRQFLIQPRSIAALLFLQIIPLILLPPSSLSIATQEWWLPILLAALALFAALQLVVRHSVAQWPWYLSAFSQGFNIISRLMLLMPHATVNENGTTVFNTLYVVLTLISIILSGFFLWYTEWPEVRLGLLRTE